MHCKLRRLWTYDWLRIVRSPNLVWSDTAAAFEWVVSSVDRRWQQPWRLQMKSRENLNRSSIDDDDRVVEGENENKKNRFSVLFALYMLAELSSTSHYYGFHAALLLCCLNWFRSLTGLCGLRARLYIASTLCQSIVAFITLRSIIAELTGNKRRLLMSKTDDAHFGGDDCHI